MTLVDLKLALRTVYFVLLLAVLLDTEHHFGLRVKNLHTGALKHF